MGSGYNRFVFLFVHNLSAYFLRVNSEINLVRTFTTSIHSKLQQYVEVLPNRLELNTFLLCTMQKLIGRLMFEVCHHTSSNKHSEQNITIVKCTINVARTNLCFFQFKLGTSFLWNCLLTAS